MYYRPHRYQTQYPVTVRYRLGQDRAQVLDVNTTGARMSGLGPLRRGEKITLIVLSHQIDAVVVWAVKDTVGVMFRPAIGNSMVDTLRHRRDGRREMGRGTVGFQFAELS